MWTETVRMLRAVVDRSTHDRPVADGLNLTGVYGGRPVMMTMLNEGDVARCNPLNVRVHQQGNTEGTRRTE